MNEAQRVPRILLNGQCAHCPVVPLSFQSCYPTGMTDREQLLFAIAYAIKLKARFPTRKKDAPPLDVADFTGVAQTIVEHLEASGYRIERKPFESAGPGLHAKT